MKKGKCNGKASRIRFLMVERIVCELTKPMTCDGIINKLQEEYGIQTERRTIARDLDALEVIYPITRTHRGVMIEGEKYMKEIDIEVVWCNPGKVAQITRILNELGEMQKLVGGFIETVKLFGGIEYDILLVCNDMGKLNGLEPNRRAGCLFFRNKENDTQYYDNLLNGDIICGPFFIAAVDRDGDFCNMSEKDKKILMDIFMYPAK